MSARLLTAASKMRAQSSLNQTLFYTGEFVCNVGCNIHSYNLYQRVGRNGSIPYAGPSRFPESGSVQQGLSAAYEFFDRFKFLCAADKRYTLYGWLYRKNFLPPRSRTPAWSAVAHASSRTKTVGGINIVQLTLNIDAPETVLRRFQNTVQCVKTLFEFHRARIHHPL